MSGRGIVTGLAAAAAIVFSASAQTPLSVSARIESISAEIHPELVQWRREFHRYPELSNREYKTGEKVSAQLRALALEDVRHPVARTGVVALLRGGRPGPVVAVRADMDALPIQEANDVPYKSTVAGVKHACGHDAHMAIGLGVAKILSRLRDELPGTVKFIFQPAEEGPPQGEEGGARLMIKEGALDNPRVEAIFGLHMMPQYRVGEINYNAGATMASSNTFEVDVIGRKTHGAYPHTGVDPIPIAAQVVLGLQTIPSRQNDATSPIVISVGIIQGGNRQNIIADRVQLVGTVRTLRRGGPDWVRDRIEQVVKGICDANGATYAFRFREGNPVTYNDPQLTQRVATALSQAVAAGKVLNRVPQMGAEDFSRYQEVIPGFFFFVGVSNPDKGITAMIHTEDFDIDEEALDIGARAMSNVVWQYLTTERR